ESDKLEKEVELIEKDKQVVEKELEEAKPELIKAQEALKTIKPQDIAVIRALKTPPPLVKRVMDGVLLLRHKPIGSVEIDQEFEAKTKRKVYKASWKQSQIMMNDVAFLQSLLTFDKDAVNDETCELLEPYLREPD